MSSDLQAYCIKCKEKRSIKNAKAVLMKNNQPAIRGECEECGSKMYRIVKI